MALLSMIVIIVAVVTQGPRVPAEMRGQIKGSLLINDGALQAIGVISFGSSSPRHGIDCILTCFSVRLSSQLTPDIRLVEEADNRSFCQSYSFQHRHLHGGLPSNVTQWISEFWCLDPRQHSKQLPDRQHSRQHCSTLPWLEHAHDVAAGSVCLQGGHDRILLPSRTIRPQQTSHIHYGSGPVCHDDELTYLRSWYRIRTCWGY